MNYYIRHLLVDEEEGFNNASIPSGIEGLIVSLFSIGAMTTACPFISSFFLDYWGREVSTMLGSLGFIVGSAVARREMHGRDVDRSLSSLVSSWRLLGVLVLGAAGSPQRRPWAAVSSHQRERLRDDVKVR